MKRYETNEIIECLKSNNLLNDEVRKILIINEEKDVSEYSLEEIFDTDELNILKDYAIVHIYEDTIEKTITIKETNLVLSRRLADGRYKYRDLVISEKGRKYLSEEYD